jgi:hydrogenase maturation protease
MCAASTAERPPEAEPRGAVAGAPTLVVGLGNPLLGDDGVGWLVVETVEAAVEGGHGERVDRRGLAFDCLAVGGLALMERLVGVRRAILVDAVVTGRDPAGTVRRLDLSAIPGREASHLDSAHDVTLVTALEAGRGLGASLPEDVDIVTIEAVRVGEFTEALTPAVAAAIPEAAERVLALLEARG